ncbi:hypothetical protein [Leifsonia aquatica]|uniref:hypothetical protein n=1 Tax=Leifsonia aquatica TaxID=144185 RepID=UPI0028AA35B4|nr:hypothetical protein [Leifsonia aquatica]
MASKGYTIAVATDSRLFEQGVRMGIIKPIEDADDALTDLGKNRGPDQLADELKDAQRATDKLGDEARQNARQMQSDYRKTGQVARDAADEGGTGWSSATRKASKESGESIREFGSEAKQNIGETFSSFRGDASDFAQIFQDTLGGLASGLEGIPAIAAVAAGAAGIGLILGAIENGQEQSEAWKQDVADLTQQFIDAGRRGPDAIDAMADKLKELATQTDDAGVSLSKLDDLTSRSGTSFEDAAQAYAGNTDALRELVRQGKDRLEQLQREGTATDQNNAKQVEAYGKVIDQANAQKELNTYLEQASQKADEAAKNAERYAESGAAGMAAKAEQIRSIDQAYDDAAGAAEDYVDAESGIFDVQKYIDAMTAKAAALDAYKDNFATAALTLSPEAQAFIQSQGEESAAQFTAAYVAAAPDQQQRLNAIWTTAGKTSADSYANSIKSNLPPTVDGPTVVIKDVDTSRVIGQISQTLAGHTFKVNALATVRVGNAVN